MESTVVAELAWALTRAGHPTFRFNFRGVGASEGRFDETTLGDDLEAAERHFAETLAGAPGGSPPSPWCGLCGVGRGADLVMGRALAHPDRYAGVLAVSPTAAEPPPRSALTRVKGPFVVAFPQHHSAPKDRWRAELEAAPDGRCLSIPRADPGFVRGLVDLGRAAAQVFDSDLGLR